MAAPTVYRFEFLEKGQKPQRPGHQPLRLDSDVDVQENALRELVRSRLYDEDIDLLLLAAAVSHVDRTARRLLGTGWARELHVVMPVHDVDRWAHGHIVKALSASLRLLTGDYWSFEFVTRAERDQRFQLDLFKDFSGRALVLPYSGGLDSYCAAAELEPEPGETVLLVHTRSDRGIRKQLAETLRGRPSIHVEVPLSHRGLNHPEQSYRTRTFTFLVVAAVAARSGGGRSIVVGENGQGAIGPALAWFTGEHPYYSMHPRFTRSMAGFLDAVWAGSHSIEFRHTAVLRTKGEVLSALQSQGKLGDWERTRSCSRSPRSTGAGSPRHCGLCGGCLLRRLALHAAGIASFAGNREGYLWGDLTEESLRDPRGTGRGLAGSDLDLAVHAVKDLAYLAEYAKRPPGDPDVENLVEDLAHGMSISIDAARGGVERFLTMHLAEWTSALGTLPSSAWLRRVAEGGS